MPRVSIGLPVYNGDRYLRQAISSILGQSYRDFELIISDNASTDGTEAICQAFAAQDQRITYVRQPQNLGAAPNFNICFALASGEYFKWAAHDDYIEPDYLARCVEALDANPNAALCQSLVRLIDDQERLLEVHRPMGPASASSRPSRRFAARMCKRRCLDIFGLIRTKTLRDSVLIGSYIGMDRALLLELALRGPFVLINEPLFTNRDHCGRATRITRTGTRKDLVILYDTANAGKAVFSSWMFYKESTRIIWKNVGSWSERLRCFAHLVLSRGHRRYVRSLVTEFIAIVQTRRPV
jgi:glycosyltransferase involved in cell wall biosynthesis